MPRSSKATAAADEQPPSLIPPTEDAADKGKRRAKRTYPGMTLKDALLVAEVIQDKASGTPVDRLTLSELVKKSPDSSDFRDLVMASRKYGLTDGGQQSSTFSLTTIGDAATGADEDKQLQARRGVVLSIEPYRLFLNAYNGKKIPVENVFIAQLKTQFQVPADRAKECMNFLLADAELVGFIRKIPTGEYIDLAGAKPPTPAAVAAQVDEQDEDDIRSTGVLERPETVETPRLTVVRNPDKETLPTPPAPVKEMKVFIAHGKDRRPLEHIKKTLDAIKLPYAVAVDEANRGRPISAKVAGLMREDCSAAIFIFTADEHFQQTDADGNVKDMWRPSENVVYELGAASILYGNRIVIFKDSRVTLASDFSDLGYIPFEEGEIARYSGNLIQELVELHIIKVSV